MRARVQRFERRPAGVCIPVGAAHHHEQGLTFLSQLPLWIQPGMRTEGCLCTQRLPLPHRLAGATKQPKLSLKAVVRFGGLGGLGGLGDQGPLAGLRL